MVYRTFIFTCILGILLTACGGNKPAPADADSSALLTPAQPDAGAHTPNGSYQGTLPCADCPGIDYQISLYDNNHYKTLMVYRDRNQNRPMVDTGTWKIEQDSMVRITLSGQSKQTFLFEDGRLYQLNEHGQRITGALADNYILRPVKGGDAARLQQKAAEGIDFMAAGIHPAWSLEMDRQKTIFFQTVQGDSIRVPAPRPRPDTDTLRVYTAKTEKAEFILTIRNSACIDDVNGFMRPYAVEVQLKDSTYKGCGEYLK
ncbi:MAG TPA: copper resistance protein NlpE N-terminal domain-containing protein [Chitinophaga sp.]|uniref:copper resistance protein NlpE N-terminal domain-containing protein n=1 Tax=Chitinophaga sp. TaxID=1869181 RepID=UPI002F935FC7